MMIKYLASALIFLLFLYSHSITAGSVVSESLESKWTFPGYNEASECDLAEVGAENMVSAFVRKVGKTSIISVESDKCQCRDAKSKNKYQCKARATVTYYQHSTDPTEQKFKAELLDKYINHITPSFTSVLSPFVKLQKNSGLKGGMLGALKGTKIFGYANAGLEVLSKAQAIKNRLGSLNSSVNQTLDKTTEKLLKDLQRAHNRAESKRSSLSKLSKGYFRNSTDFFDQYKQHHANGFRVDKCIRSVSGGKSPTFKNTCDYPVRMHWCAENVKKACGSKNKKYYTHSTLLRPNQEHNNRYSMPSGKTVKHVACVGNRSAKHNKTSLECANPY